MTRTLFHNKLAKNIHSIEWSVICIIDNKKAALEAEKYYIVKYNSYYQNGFNLTTSGEGVWGSKHAEEIKNKIRKANLGLKRSQKIKRLISLATKGKKKSLVSQADLDVRAASMGSKPFDVFTKDWVYVGTWINKSKCAKDLGVSRGTIIRRMNQRSFTQDPKFIYIEKQDA